ncbi:MAG: class I SAM-dependent RNA methyltransferase [Phenylobacterium sp.]|uniref:class I SAM-dependent RNA methyltransferase n=1 Tax=Phenylobacterium sp. TaxID=1871053 RepID=UPI002719C0CD|nr:class I SAM-dependent RNA methyltransferase [Phenylobacterium sp.]MDO8321558.1 class I SAM-dependent RNA methyltransferase [Phenylobacterium sp.]MDO8911360.1 class I SAM-dependent RNA methyltransferase [Phenylobacterium sp.]MDO9247671.1 class I SAM-dependent RNA methyltransferase [Phenylobacterium sp.]MDP2012417.1 class I SAM-dependent RNA methyltransferase [Phenylobacterium sp.]MDP3099063.1 class I SAM-dependent RNA methyltransferase [Phenylobacterium sp.]
MRSSNRRPEPPKPSGPPVEVVIETIGGEGDGVAPGPIYVPFTLPGETVRATGAGERRDLDAVLVASPERVTPPCPHFGVCGGCALQHWEHAAYLAWKVERLRKTLGLQHIETEILAPFASPPASRRRLALHARPGKRGEARLGYKTRKSWDVIDIAVCPIADPRLEAALPALRRLAAPLLQHPKSAPTLHVTLTTEGLDVEITGVERKSGGLSADARMQLGQIAAEAGFARVTMDGEVQYGARQPLIRVGPAVVALPAGAFLQAVPAAEAMMAAFAVEQVAGAERIADLYCGVGTFTFRLAQVAPVYAADGHAPAIRALTQAIATAPGLKGVTAETRDLARRPVLAVEFKKIDTVLFDPPRAGALEQTAEIAASKVAKVIGVSCNPATFARDARVLIDAGFSLDRVLPVDQFLWSPHVELVGVFTR